MTTTQDRIHDTLSRAGIPAKEIKVYGSQVVIVCFGESSARRFATLLHSFCSIVRGPVESWEHDKVNTNTVLRPSSHRVWLVAGTI